MSEAPNQSRSIFVSLMLTVVIIIAVAVLTVVYLLDRQEFQFNETLATPRIENLPDYSNKTKIDISGEASESATLALFIDHEDSGLRADANTKGSYEFDNVKLEKEKEYKFKVAQVDEVLFGIAKKDRSKFSSVESVIADRTAPQARVLIDDLPKETAEKLFSIHGATDIIDAVVVVKTGDKEYESEIGENGRFFVEEITLETFSTERPKINDMINSQVAEILYLKEIYESKGEDAVWQAILVQSISYKRALMEVFGSLARPNAEMLKEIVSAKMVLDGLKSSDPARRHKLLNACEVTGCQCYQHTENGWNELTREERASIRWQYTKAFAVWKLGH